MRKLATIRKIVDLQPIPGADAIEVATVDSWKVVVKKGEFQLHDLVLYIEVDSWVPHELAPFLSKGQEPREYNGIKGERLRTIKLRGQVSQGLILPLWDSNYLVQKFARVENVANRPYPVWVETLTENGWYVMPDGRCVESALFELDLSESFGIVKYEPPVPACLAGVVKGSFPSCFPKTDEERIQNLTDEWPLLRTYTYEVSEKLEGSSMSVGLLSDTEFIVCSRNLNLKETEDNTLWKVARAYDIERKLLDVPTTGGIIIQGELVGEGIQGNYYDIKGHDFYVFAIYDVGGGKYYTPAERHELCQTLGLKHVPVIDVHASVDMSIEDMLRNADGPSIINPKKKREGVVYKQDDGKGQAHFKTVSNDYLISTGG